MNKILIKCRNVDISDILFASSIAKKLKNTQQCEVHFDINYLQPIELLNCNPYIDRVFFQDSDENYDEIFTLIPKNHELNNYESRPSQFQKMCNIKSFDDTFEIFTNEVLDYSITTSMGELINIGDWESDIIKVGYQMDWHKKSFLFTETQFTKSNIRKSSVKHRDIFNIINRMETHKKIILFAVGIEDTISKRYPTLNSTSKFSFTASLIKNCDYVIGADGCLTNISSALGIPTIITTDRIYYNAIHKNLPTQTDAFIGPCKYFPKSNHVHLNPFLTDEEVGSEILKIVTNGR